MTSSPTTATTWDPFPDGERLRVPASAPGRGGFRRPSPSVASRPAVCLLITLTPSLSYPTPYFWPVWPHDPTHKPSLPLSHFVSHCFDSSRMELSDRERERLPPPSIVVDIDSDEAIARQLHEMEMERAVQLARRNDPLALPSPRLFCITRRAMNWAYFVYLILEFAAMIPVMILSARERFVCEHSNLRVWILLWESRILVALPLVAVKLRKRRRQSFAFDLINSLLSVYIIVMFFWGNLLLFGPGASQCYGKSPISLAFVIAVISILYAYLAVPVIALTLICLCLPVYFIVSTFIKSSLDRRNSDPIDMASLQTRKFTKGAETEGEDPKCAICMNDFVPEESTVTTLPCGHEFDRECIEYWLSIKKQCAICRQDIGESMRLRPDPSQPAS